MITSVLFRCENKVAKYDVHSGQQIIINFW